jgi:hypothetical protein
VDFQEELKILDQKLSMRYHLGPFGSTDRRFKSERPDPIKESLILENKQNQATYNIQKKHEVRKYMDQALQLVKHMQTNKESS